MIVGVYSRLEILVAFNELGDKIWAVGGKDSNGATPSKIEAFDPTTKSWADLPQQLQSTDTSELVVSKIPSSALDCVSPCQCGKVKEGRILNGNEAQVRAFFLFFFIILYLTAQRLPLDC